MSSPSSSSSADGLVAWLSDPSSYPELPRSVHVIETHISDVFFTDEYICKLTKQLKFESLDFSTLAQREAACRDELRLNRRMAKHVYLDVLPVLHQTDGGFQWSGN